MDKKKERITESYVIATGCNNVPITETPCGEEFKDQKIKCYREIVKKEYLDDSKYCRSCGIKLKDGFLCDKCKMDNSKLPSKLLDLCRAVHAEETAILQAAKLGSISLEGAKLYSSTFPCMLCCKAIINAGIRNVVYLESYLMERSLALKMFRKCKVGVTKYEGVTSLAFNRIFKRSS
jgi:deoxycytidylate deaminase